MESIPRAYVAWRAGTTTLFAITARWESIPGLLKRFTSLGSYTDQTEELTTKTFASGEENT
jgi:hypothetical protein